MDHLLLIKWLHILSSTVLFGTGLGTAFFLWSAHLTGDARTIASVAKITVRADWLFTATSGIVQPVTGLALAHGYGHALTLRPCARLLAAGGETANGNARPRRKGSRRGNTAARPLPTRRATVVHLGLARLHRPSRGLLAHADTSLVCRAMARCD